MNDTQKEHYEVVWNVQIQVLLKYPVLRPYPIKSVTNRCRV